MTVIGTVESVWRYPVKSMAGESLAVAHLGFAGVYGDRLFAFASTASPSAFPFLTAREQPRMLGYRPRFVRPEEASLPPNLEEAQSTGSGLTPVHGNAEQLRLEIELPAGRTLPIESPELLKELRDGLDEKHALSLIRSERAQTDCRPVSLISLQTVSALGDALGSPLEKRRFRANLYLDMGTEPGFAEDRCIGRTVKIGDQAVVAFLQRDSRCKIITLDPDTGASSPEIMRELARGHDAKAGVYCAVLVEGTVRPGDEVSLQ